VSDDRGFVRGLVMLALIALCIWLAYLYGRGDVADMVAAFIHRVRMMGQPN
jgi:hypothetical protein